MSSRRNRRDHRGSSSENGNEAWQRGLKEEEHMAGRAEQSRAEREREREEWGKKESNEGNSDRFVKISLRLGLATVP